MVDLKGIEPSNLTDANRALSQLSYRPKSALFTKKVANFGFLEYSIFRGKSNKSDRKTGNGKSGRMCLAMDANVMRFQLRYRPKFQADSKDSFYIITDFPKM